MSPRVRVALFLVSAVVCGALLLWGFGGLPAFGHYRGPYGTILNVVAPKQRHITNVVTAVNYDYRGMDTLGEEFILFTAVAGVALLLREKHEEEELPEDRTLDTATGRLIPEQTEAIRAAGFVFFGLTVLFALYVIAHGHLTPGGGFQGGSILASAWTLSYLAGSYRIYHRLTPQAFVEVLDAGGGGAYAVVGLATLATGASFLQNVLPYGTLRDLLSGGTITVINFAVGVEVTAGLLLVFAEFFKQVVVIRERQNQEKEQQV